MNALLLTATRLIALSLLLCSAIAQVWEPVVPGRNASVVADTTRGRVLFLGANNSWPSWWSGRSVWFDGQHFAPAPSGGAIALGEVAFMAHDPLRARTVWIGGLTPQTWEYDGSSWTHLAVASPPYAGHLVWHASLGRIVLVSYDGSTWLWDGIAWTQVPGIPFAVLRGEFALAYDEARQATVLFGGVAASGTVYADTWEFDAAGWQLRTPAHTPVAGRVTAAFDRVRQRIVLRVNDPPLPTTWEYDGIDWVTIPSVVPAPAAWGTRLVTSPTNGRCWLFDGGWSPIETVHVRELQGQSWVPLTGSLVPGPRFGAGVAVDLRRDAVWVHGGRSAGNPLTDEDSLWVRVGGTWIETVVNPRPSARAFHGFVHDEARDCTLLFGGRAGGGFLGDTWELRAGQWTLRSGPGPTPRGRFGMVYDPLRARIVLFGGQGTTLQNDVWLFTANGWTPWPLPAGPSARAGHAMTYDAAKDRVIVFGGETSAGATADTWALTATGWTQLATTSAPSPRHGAAMAYDPFADRVVLVGGRFGNTSLADVWELRGTQWAPSGAALPAEEGTWYAAALVARSSTPRLELLFGAHVWTFFLVMETGRNDEWHLTPGTTPQVAMHGTGCAGSAGVPSLAPAPGSLPQLGATFSLLLTNVPSTPGVAFVAVGNDIATFAGQPLPLALDGAGLPGCPLWIAPEFAFGATVSAGAASWSWLLPANPALSGAVVALQALVPDGGMATFGTVSNAVVAIAH